MEQAAGICCWADPAAKPSQLYPTEHLYLGPRHILKCPDLSVPVHCLGSMSCCLHHTCDSCPDAWEPTLMALPMHAVLVTTCECEVGGRARTDKQWEGKEQESRNHTAKMTVPDIRKPTDKGHPVPQDHRYVQNQKHLTLAWVQPYLCCAF